MVKKSAGKRAEGDDKIAVDQRVRVYVDTDDEVRGVVVEDFGDLAGHAVDVGDVHISDAARRWAVLTDAGTLVFVDSHQIASE
ncbi:hypothetical protein [Mycolicibacterium aichiense]|uniref:Uncharacterized protein n=1 Tax=Mycolicibacterium aichiense TaxID=1799 RepID=A0AAD1MFB3_9MYCO|nr:hypothetical protein [Mycolicibacterium aichiense]MCV7017132.1 hypothetical protein [Mycolicibacterium aichiense]BBX10440.1 hypothetical protein MAIC_52430 [Mycolicibacterium aichiense]STZ25902.1 Uncharacterised protein [Mycolicibacterium aichiense]